MKYPGIAWLLAAVLALIIVWKAVQTDADSAPAVSAVTSTEPVARLERRIELLEAELTQSMLQRRQLEQRLTRLERGQADREERVDPGPQNDFIHSEETGQSQTSLAEDTEDAPSESLQERLFSAGLPTETIQAIQQTIDGNRLQMLELRDRAIREGWDDTQEYSEKIHELNDATRGLREQFGDEVFDQYLYAAGRPNRVVVREVYGGSAAANAGIQVGDIITGYASSNVFTMSDLRQGTLQGTAGETVLVEIMRDGQPFTTTVLRGPLGISMQTASVNPR